MAAMMTSSSVESYDSSSVLDSPTVGIPRRYEDSTIQPSKTSGYALSRGSDLTRRYTTLSLTLSLLALVPVGVIAWPVLALLSIIPFVGFVALPSLLGLTLFLAFGIAWLPYLMLAQTDSPETSRVKSSKSRGALATRRWPYLPYSPMRCLKIDRTILRWARDGLRLGLIELSFDWAYRRIMVMGGHEAREIVKEGILYSSPVIDDQIDAEISYINHHGKNGRSTSVRRGKRLDVYRAYIAPSQAAAADAPLDTSSSRAQPVRSPVIVFIPSAMWTFGNRRQFIQLALKLRRMGRVVVIPDLTLYPEGSCREMVHDIRRVLEWVGAHITNYGGDPNQIYLMGHGSGSHLALLTVVQEAVVRSRDEYWLRTYQQKTLNSANRTESVGSVGDESIGSQDEIEISAGIRRVEIWGESADVPDIRGLILLSGIADVIKHIRYEAKVQIEQFSPMRRAIGPSHAACLMASPSHLLYGSKQVLDPAKLPGKILLMHGGADRDVPIAQTILLKTLLVGVGAKDVRLRAYRDMSHMEALTALMLGAKHSKYSAVMESEILDLTTT